MADRLGLRSGCLPQMGPALSSFPQSPHPAICDPEARVLPFFLESYSFSHVFIKGEKGDKEVYDLSCTGSHSTSLISPPGTCSIQVYLASLLSPSGISFLKLSLQLHKNPLHLCFLFMHRALSFTPNKNPRGIYYFLHFREELSPGEMK